MTKPSSRHKRFIFLRSGTLLIGLLLAVLAFAAYFFLGNVLNPPPYQVVIVVQEISPGETLKQSMLSVDAQQVHPKVVEEYVLQDELASWLGATVNEPLHPGDPLTKARLVQAGNPAAARHLAIALEEPNQVAMVIPVNPETCPSRILPGDLVDISFSIGQVQQSTSHELVSPTPTPLSPITLPRTSEQDELSGLATEDIGPVMAGPEREPDMEKKEESLDIPTSATILEESEISEQLEAALPLAKIVLQSVEVLDVHFEERPNPSYSENEQGVSEATIQGDIFSLEVIIPAGAVEMLHFAIENGSVRISLLSPNSPSAGERGPTLGMTWEDLVAFFEAERREVLGIQEGMTGATFIPSQTLTDTVMITGTISATSTFTVLSTPNSPGASQSSRQFQEETAGSTPPPPTAGETALALGDVAPFACGGLALILIPIVVLVLIQRRRRSNTTVPSSSAAPPSHQPSLDIQP